MLGKLKRDVLPDRPQVIRGGADAERVEQPRSSLHRLAPVALTALGIAGAVLMIFGGLVALNHTVLPFDGWPLNGDRQGNGTQILPRAPAKTGRLRTATGGTLAEGSEGAVVIAGPAQGSLAALGALSTRSAGLVPQRGVSDSAAPSVPLLLRAGVDSDRDGVDNQTE